MSLAARTVRIDAVRVLGYEWPFLDVEIDCGKGTYIRSIARDLGARLGCGGMVETLRRTRVGPFTAEQGIGLDVSPEEARAKLLPMSAAVAGLPQVRFAPDDVKRFRNGQSVRITPASGGRQPPECTTVAVLDDTGELVGIGAAARGVVKPQTVFPANGPA